ncbi:MAG: hypothetical protein LC804_11650 [Acidobacteria bacterium]|nr:hypothetical protein [Acidobacteriota bacterium]
MHLHITDEDLLRGFEDASLPDGAFGHAEHVRVTCLYLDAHGRDGALERLATGLLRFTTRHGHPAKFSYSLTAAWVDTIESARRSHPDARTFDALVAACPSLLDRASVRHSSESV